MIWGSCPMAGRSFFGPRSTFRHADDPTISRTVFQSRRNGVFATHSRPLFQQFTQSRRVAHSIALAVVVEISKYLALHGGPLPDALCPPTETVLGIGAAIQVVWIRSMQTHVDKRCSSPQDAGKLRSAHHAVGSAVSLQEIEYFLPMPARVAELQGNPQSCRCSLKEVFQAGVVVHHVGWELHEQDTTFGSKMTQATPYALQPILRRVKALAVGQATGCFYRHQEIIGNSTKPNGNS